MTQYRILFIPSPVGPLGSGQGGGVETNIINIAPYLAQQGHKIGVIAAKGSQALAGVTIYEVEGALPPYALHTKRNALPVVQADGLLEHLWEKAAAIQQEYDLIVGINYDWIAYFLTPFFTTPVVHIISISSLIDSVDQIIAKRYKENPKRFAVNTKIQAETYAFMNAETITKLYGGVNLSTFQFSKHAEHQLCWVGRISPEKNIQDALLTARALQLPIAICGTIQDQEYWEKIQKEFSDVTYMYHGLLPQEKLAKIIGNSSVFLMTSKKPLVEAFGNVTIESLACGTPVVAYAGGGADEIIENGKSGYMVESQQQTDFTQAVKDAFLLDRMKVRERGEAFSLEQMAKRYVTWFDSIK